MSPHDMDLIDHPAGPDENLRLACEDLQLDRWLEAKRLLRDTGSDWTLRTSRSQVLARVAANYRAIDAWCAEEPDDWDALMMRARVLTERVLNTHRAGGSGRDLMRAAAAARLACKAAAERWPDDPVPYVCYLALAQTDTDRQFPHSPVHWEEHRNDNDMLPPGPWRVLAWADQRDQYNREAYHRMLNVFQARQTGVLDFAQTVAAFAPEGSPLVLLPLYAFTEAYRRQLEGGRTVSVIGYWATVDKAHYARRALHEWFEFRPTPPEQLPARSLVDLNYLAYTLTATGEGNAAGVFEAIGPYATAAPWIHVTPKAEWWQDDFRKARRQALSVGSRR
ncbi:MULTISPECIES: hypothetical protein [unclassified Streptomyces]|uniref:hypothetical protein n=2 Tax=Streptomyces TaxID=1883 RepID=UPI00364C5814